MPKPTHTTAREAARKARRIVKANYEADPLATGISDLLADLLHLCDASKLDFSECLQAAERHYIEEFKEHEASKAQPASNPRPDVSPLLLAMIRRASKRGA